MNIFFSNLIITLLTTGVAAFYGKDAVKTTLSIAIMVLVVFDAVNNYYHYFDEVAAENFYYKKRNPNTTEVSFYQYRKNYLIGSTVWACLTLVILLIEYYSKTTKTH